MKRDYEGLQLDTRAREVTDKHLDPAKPFQLKPSRDSRGDQKYGYFNEKEVGFDEKGQTQMHVSASDSPTSPSSTMVGGDTPQDYRPKGVDEIVGRPPPPKERKICGLRPPYFWTLFAVCLSLVIAAAIVGGVLGARNRNASNTTPGPASSVSGAAAGSNPSATASATASASATLAATNLL